MNQFVTKVFHSFRINQKMRKTEKFGENILEQFSPGAHILKVCEISIGGAQ